MNEKTGQEKATSEEAGKAGTAATCGPDTPCRRDPGECPFRRPSPTDSGRGEVLRPLEEAIDLTVLYLNTEIDLLRRTYSDEMYSLKALLLARDLIRRLLEENNLLKTGEKP